MYSSNIIILALRVAQFTLAFVVLGLSSFVANWYNAEVKSASPPQIGWLLFVSIFTIISVGVLEGLPRFAPRFFHPYAALSLEFGNTLFYFAGFISLSAYMSWLPFCRGSVCGAARADVAFAVFQFLLWAASSSLAGRELFRKGMGFGRAKSADTQAPLGAPPMKETADP
ncbi:putative Non-classical export protein 2 [Rosellinia necatrix]|uniref:Putative Non-classical export protein 2 n=1 Tax=Rosellinia necatrix TaxID=77044 RepID=A0A1W2TIG4_ROSNE|nr:putative Non-classical export protein 2 [Rosellinia necatrix]